MDSSVSAVIGRARDFRLEAALAASFTLVVVASAYAAGVAITDSIIASAPVSAPAPVAAPDSEPAPPPKPKPFLVVAEPVRGGEINSPFGLRRLPWENHGRLHEGVDISGNLGEPVYAAAEGLIARAGNSPTYGRHVEIRHVGGLTTLYAHLGRIDPQLRQGVWVKNGQPIGKVGSSGTSTGPHVHFEIRRKDRPLNPAAFIGREFATAADLPLKEAAGYSRRVRVAQVSFIPESKRALMEGKDPKEAVKQGKDGRPRASIQFASKPQTGKPLIIVEEAPSAESAATDSNAVLPVAAPIPTAPLTVGAD